jgi:hypothetical protein
MARTVRDENIGSRNARLALTPRRKPYFRAIAQGLHLGYRRNRAGNGSWVARRYLAASATRPRSSPGPTTTATPTASTS